MEKITTTGRFTGVLYGLPGVGKTNFVGTAGEHPNMANVLIIDTELGLASISSPNVFREQVSTQTELEGVFWKLAQAQDDYATIKTVVIDSLTVMQKLHLAELAEDSGDIDSIQLQHYGKDTAFISRMVRQFCALPMNVIFTALVRYQYPPGGEKSKAPAIAAIPDMTEKLSAVVQGAVDNVWYQYVEGGRRFLITQPTGIYSAKTRGIVFSKALGAKVAVYDALADKQDPQTHTLASIYSMLIGE